MKRRSWRLAPIGLVAVLAATTARADIRVTLTDSSGTSTSAVETGSVGSTFFTVAGSIFTISTNSTSPGQLTSGLQFYPTQAISQLTVLVQDVTAGSTASDYTLQQFSPGSSAGFTETASAAQLMGGADNFVGTTLVNNQTTGAAMASFTATGLAPVTGMGYGVAGAASTYTLAETYSLTNITPGSLVNVSFTSMVSPNAAPSATPEPSTFVLVGLTGLGLAGVGLRRRWRVDAS